MAIEVREVNGTKLGYNTETRSYFNLPNDFVDYSKNITFDDMSVEELITYAAQNKIDIGKATSHSGIVEKIMASKD